MAGRGLATLVTTALLLGACGGGDPEPTSADGAALDLLEADHSADIADIEAGAGAQPGPFRPGIDGELLVIGEQVSTPSQNEAVVQWLTGVVTHVQPDTIYTLVNYSLDPGDVQIVTRLDVGRTWHKVQLGATDGFDVETSVGTAAVRGTAFGVNCSDNGCSFSVAEGVVEVTTTLGIVVEVRSGESVLVAPDGVAGGIEEFTTLDEQNAESVRRDLDAGRDYDVEVNVEGDGPGSFTPGQRTADGGIDSAAPDGGRDDTARGRLQGTYDLKIVVTESTVPEQIGGEQTRRYTFTPSCDAGPCGGDWDPGDGRPVPFTWTGQGYAAAFVDRDAFTEAACNDAGVRSWIEDFVFSVTPTAVKEVNGRLVVTEFTHTWDTILDRPAEVEANGCHPYPSQRATVTGTGTRR